MSTIISARIEWNLHIGNLPRVELVLDNLVDWKDAVYEERLRQYDGCSVYISRNDPFCHFLLANPKNKSGYGGSSFSLKLFNGKQKMVTGPWSSRASVVNHHFGTAYIDATYKVQGGSSLQYPCAVDSSAVIPYLPDEVTFEVIVSDRFKDKTFIPTYKGLTYIETKQYLRSLPKR